MAKKKKNKLQKNIRSCTLYVEGMHCASCEVLIEKKLLKQKQIESVDASLSNNKVRINFSGNGKINIDDLNEEFNELGYKFSNNSYKKKEPPLFSTKNGGLAVNPKKFANYLKVILIFISFLIAFLIFEKLQFGKYTSIDSTSSAPAFLILGLVAGLSSCAALIGGLLLSMIKQWNELYIAESPMTKSQPHIMFHIGRLLSFLILGGLLGMIGEKISLNNSVFFSILTIFVSIVMFMLALQMLNISLAKKFKFTAPKGLIRFAADETNFQGRYMPFIIGVLTFFLPCGFTLIAQTAALTSGSFFQGSLIMFLFALGTLPILVGISLSGLKFNSKPHLTAKFNAVAGLLIVFFAIYNINGQLNVLGYPSLSDIHFNTKATDKQELAKSNDGIQELHFVAEGFEYRPTSTTTIKSGEPAMLIVDNKGIQGCGAFISARGLFDNYVALKKGINKIDLGTPEKGTYKLTCSMGMVRPITITVI